MTTLITGATGFLGSHLTRRMIAEGHSVRILCRPTSSDARLKGLKFERFLGDVTDTESVRAAMKDCEFVIHAAADMSYWSGGEDRQTRVNVDGTRNVARAAREAGVKRLLHVSSVAAVGIPTDPRQPANEQFGFNLENSRLTYHISKRRAEDDVLVEVAHGLDAVIVNPASIQGRERTIALLNSVRRSSIVPCFSGGNCIVDIEDVVDGITAALASGKTGERYILGGENLTFRSLSEKAAKALGLKRWFVLIPPFATKVAAAVLEPWARVRNRRPKITYMVHYCANRFQYFDSSKARRTLGYAPRNMETVLKECIGSI